MLYYELEDGLYTAGPYFFAKVRAGSKCWSIAHIAGKDFYRNTQLCSLYKSFRDLLVIKLSPERPGLGGRNGPFLGSQI